MKTTYCQQVHHSHETALMVSVNDIPLYDRVMGNEGLSTTTSPDQWLMPGKNTLSLTMKRGAVSSTTAISTILRDMNTNTKLATIIWPQDFATPTDPAPLGTRTVSFEIPATHERPVFMDAPRTQVPREGNAAVWAALQSIVQAFEKGDANAVYDALRLKTEEHHRFHGTDNSAPATVQKTIQERMGEPYHMMPLDREQIVFEPCLDERLYRVYRRDGVPVIYGYPATAKKPAYSVNPFLVFHQGQYRMLF